MEENNSKFSFTFSQKVTTKVLPKKISQTFPVDTNAGCLFKEFINSIEDNVLQATTPKSNQEPVIPLKRRWTGHLCNVRTNYIRVDPKDTLTVQALQEISDDIRVLNGEVIDQPLGLNYGVSIASPNVNERIEDPNYSEIPIEKFGMAMLAGMGLDPKEISQNKSDILGPQRPKGLGLGADPRAIQAAKAKQVNSSDQPLTWKMGATCQILFGKHKGLYGIVQGLDGDTGRVIIQLAISKQVVPILQHSVRLVPEKEYNAYSHCLNQQEVEKYKADEAVKIEAAMIPVENGNYADFHKFPPATSDELRRSSPSTTHHLSRSAANIIAETKLYVQSTDVHKRKTNSAWIRPKLIVRFMDKRYHNGKYYKQKMTIVNVNSERCNCKTESGHLIENIRSKYLETVVPHEVNSILMIVDGDRAGQLARLIRRDSSNNQVDVKTRSGLLLHYDFDCVCAVKDPFGLRS